MDMYVLSILVSNHFGVLTRVTNLFGRRSYNIKELTVGETIDPRYSRITIVTEGDEPLLQQIQKQLSKLVDVKSSAIIPIGESVCRELLLVKLAASEEAKAEMEKLPCKLLEENNGCLIYEMVARPEVINSFLENMQNLDILEIARTGTTALQKGSKNILKNNGGN